ncbi:MAG: hypothetical protein LQ343_006057 [Gyalolechia ehrenbergii]|nr:MAG: hypothetical protein LQ343_006057 [Gyalolechia ehrenbergii]
MSATLLLLRLIAGAPTKTTRLSLKGGNPEGTPKSTFFVPSWDSRRVRILGLNQPASNSGKPGSESASEERILAPAEDVIRKTTDIRLDYSSHKAARQDHDEYMEMV